MHWGQRTVRRAWMRSLTTERQRHQKSCRKSPSQSWSLSHSDRAMLLAEGLTFARRRSTAAIARAGGSLKFSCFLDMSTREQRPSYLDHLGTLTDRMRASIDHLRTLLHRCWTLLMVMSLPAPSVCGCVGGDSSPLPKPNGSSSS